METIPSHQHSDHQTDSPSFVPTSYTEILYDQKDHGLISDRFNPDAVEICRVLQEAGFEAYIVGGGVRDELLQLHPKDFDIATAATPEEIQKLFKRCILIGRRFRLAHVYMDRHIFEIATFRAAHTEENSENDSQENDQGMLMRDNVYGTLSEDAIRRDFPLNALYYNPITNQIVDFTFGMRDLKERRITTIGHAPVRFTEDPVRMLRAVRIAAKLNFQISSDIIEAIYQKRLLLKFVSKARLFEEYKKLFLSGFSTSVFALLCEHQLFEILFPSTAFYLKETTTYNFILQSLHNTDARLKEDKPVNPAFLLAVFLWPRFLHMKRHIREKQGFLDAPGVDQIISDVLHAERAIMSFPKHLAQTVRDIWQLQSPLEHRKEKQIFRLLSDRRFRAAYDFLCLRQTVDQLPDELIEWWTHIQVIPHQAQLLKIEALTGKSLSSSPNKKRRRKSKSCR